MADNTPGGVYRFAKPTSQVEQFVIVKLIDLRGSGSDGDIEVVFDINPESMDHDSPSRVTTENTIGGAYQDSWGPGIERITLSGHTGWRKKTADGKDGYELMQALFAIHKRYQFICAENDPQSSVRLELTLPPRGVQGGQFGYYRVSSDRFQRQRQVDRPLLFRYAWDFTVLDDLLQGVKVDPSKRFILTGGDLTSDPFASGPNAIIGPGSPLNDGSNGQSGQSGQSAPSGPNATTGPGSPLNDGSNGSSSDPLFTTTQLQAAQKAFAQTNRPPLAPPERVILLGGGTSLEQLASSRNMTVLDIQLYAAAAGLPIPHTGIAGGVAMQVTIPPKDFLAALHGILGPNL